MRRRDLAPGLLGLLALGGTAGAQEPYPNRVVRIVVPYPPGGGTDVIARLLAQRLSEMNRRQFVVDNRAGANGNIGIVSVARAAPDGYTILLASSNALLVNPRLYNDAGYTTEQFDPLARIVGLKHLLIVNPRLGLRSVADLLALAGSRPGGLNYGSGGIGNGGHLVGELFRSRTGAPMTHVPFRGGALAMNALIAGDVDLLFATTPEALPQVTAGTVQPLVALGAERLPSLPELPTLREQGYDLPEIAPWMCLVVPRGTPAAVTSLLNGQVNAILAMEETRATFTGLGLLPLGGPASEVSRLLAEEAPVWDEVIALSGARSATAGEGTRP